MSSGTTNQPLCSEIEGKLSALIDGELPELERLGIERHLESCADCGRELELLTGAVGAIREEGRSVPGPPAWDSVKATVVASKQPKSPFGRRMGRNWTVAASIGFLAVVGRFLAHRR